MRFQIDELGTGLAPWNARRVGCRGDLHAQLNEQGEAPDPESLTLLYEHGDVKLLV
jgi:hypothetical protein